MAGKQRILVIEDDPGTLNLLNHIVLRAGYEPVLASRGEEGLHLLKTVGADLILLDIMMRGMDGWTVLKRIKQDARFGHVPVVIVSAKGPSEHSSLMDSCAGMYEAYFLKPFEVDDLVGRISQILQSGS
jgi:DNA-binding response OmpR family regulator